MVLRKIIRTIIHECLNEQCMLKESFGLNDYSGEYRDLYNFIYDNGLQREFVVKYKQIDNNLTINNWDDFVRGEMGSDEEIIECLIGKDYKIYYNEDKDMFVVAKKKANKLKYKIIQSNSNKIINVLENSGIHSEYKPRFAVISNNKIIGGSTYDITDNNVYNFDIGILDEYQGYGISKQLIDVLILDAKKLNTNAIKAQVVNNMLFDYLTELGFKGTIDSGVKYVYKEF